MSWQLDTGHTYIGFSGRHLMVSTVRGEFEQFSVVTPGGNHECAYQAAENASINNDAFCRYLTF